MYNIEPADVLLAVENGTRTAHVRTASDDAHVARVKFDKVDELGLVKVVLNGVGHLNGRIGVADDAAVVGDDVRHATDANGHLTYLKELVEGSSGVIRWTVKRPLTS
jgi:hypothetical protein